MQHQLGVMTKMMVHLLEGKKDSGEEGMEQVRPGTTTLATLAEPGETAPIDYADWLTTIEPAMQDLSDASYIWWDHIMKVSQMWYQDYVKLRPLQRTTFEATPDEELKKKKWVRVERRAVTMMMGAVPQSIKDELVATKSLTPLKIVAKLMTIYQPGGLQEKTVILRQLEDPGEPSNTAGAVSLLRKWLRWLRRAQDVGLSLPDASILVRGLTRLMRKVLASNAELGFRASLVRNTLQLDTIPGHDTVKTYAEHLLAEMEQLVHLEKKTKQAPLVPELPPTALAKPMVKNMEAPGGGRPQGGWKQGGNASASLEEGIRRAPDPAGFSSRSKGVARDAHVPSATT